MIKDKINTLLFISNYKALIRSAVWLICLFFLFGCAQAEFPGVRTPNIPAATQPYDRMKGLNEGHTSVLRVPLGEDVLVPKPLHENILPDVEVGPFELRGETLGGALQLILADYNTAMAFETNEGLTRRITVTNLHGKLVNVIEQVCSLADLYCTYENNILTVKETETFIVDLPPFGVGSDGTLDSVAFDNISTGLEALLEEAPTVDINARLLVYKATNRSNKYAKEYFRKLRKNTALIIFETHIWEVTLNNENRTGIDWQGIISSIGNFDINVNIPGTAPAGTATPIVITPTFSGSQNLNFTSILQFISAQGAVKTISQPQITVVSGGQATMEVRQSENFISEFTRTPSAVVGVPDTVSTTTDTVNTGLKITIASAWDRSTVYGTLDISLDELLRIDNFSPSPDTIIQLPSTTTRSLQTQIRVRPGDAILIAGLVTERDAYSGSGPGLLKPLFNTSRAIETNNTELVFMLKPRVVVFEDAADIANGIIRKNNLKEAALQRDKEVKEEVSVENKKEEIPVLSISPNLLAPRMGD